MSMFADITIDNVIDKVYELLGKEEQYTATTTIASDDYKNGFKDGWNQAIKDAIAAAKECY